MTALRKASVLALAVAATAALALTAPPAGATGGHADTSITLPGATGTEGVARGAGSTFYAGDLLTGDVYRGDVRRGTAAKFVDAPAGRFATGMKADLDDHLLFVAGGPTGQGYVYSTTTGAPVASYPFATAPTFINDVALTSRGAWFTDSSRAVLYFVPVRHGVPGAFTTLKLHGPAAVVGGAFNSNGIQATADGSRLLVAHSGQGVVNVVNPRTGASRTIAGLSVPNVDGILLDGRTLWVVRNADDEVVKAELSDNLRSAVVRRTVTSGLFEFPTTVALSAGHLVVANAKLDTGFPPTATQYEVVVIDR
jgi:sugar lactone lactonase YvrE